MHLFFTGSRGAGKSTLVNAILAACPGKIGGFRTRRVNTVRPGRHTVHLLPPDISAVPSEENLLFVCGSADEDMARRFDSLGCAALERSAGADLILMDELGPHEAGAAGFRAAVLNALEGNIPILGVLQQSDAPFLGQISGHPRVRVVEVTMKNREALAKSLPAMLAMLTDA